MWALTILRVVLDVYKDMESGRDVMARQLQKIERWHKECEKAMMQVGGPLSAGARRDMEARIAVAAPYIETEDMEPEQRGRRWAALWWTALTELISARVMCPVYCTGRHWNYLEQTVAGLCERVLLSLWPDCDVAGTKIALEIPS